MGGTRAYCAVPHFSPRDHRHPVREGGRLRRARRRPGAHRRVARFSFEARRRSRGGNVHATGRGGAPNRRPLSVPGDPWGSSPAAAPLPPPFPPPPPPPTPPFPLR